MKLNEEWEINKDSIDNIGSILWFVSSLGLLYGISTIVTKEGAICFVISIILTIVFYYYEKRRTNRLFNVELIKNKQFMLSSTMASICSIITQSTALIMTYYLSYALKIDITTIGIILLILPIGQVIVAPLSGKLSDNINPLHIIISSFGLFIVTMFLFQRIDKLPFYFTIIILLLQSIAYALCYPSSNKYIITSVDEKDINDANGFLSNLRNGGHVIGTSITSLVFLMTIGDSAINTYGSGLISGIKGTYTIFTILSIIGLILGIYTLISSNIKIPKFKEIINKTCDYYRDNL